MLSGRDAEQGRDFTLPTHTLSLSPHLHGQGRLPAEGRVREEAVPPSAMLWRHGSEARGSAAGTRAALGVAEGQHRPSLRRQRGWRKVWVSITREESTCFLRGLGRPTAPLFVPACPAVRGRRFPGVDRTAGGWRAGGGSRAEAGAAARPVAVEMPFCPSPPPLSCLAHPRVSRKAVTAGYSLGK